MATRKDVVEQARTWLGTRWHHQGRMKKNEKTPGGADCIGLVYGVGRELGLLGTSGDITDYAMNAVDERLVEHANKVLVRKSSNYRDMITGDVIIVKRGIYPHHVMIYSGAQTFIHSCNLRKYVLESPVRGSDLAALCGVYEFPGIED